MCFIPNCVFAEIFELYKYHLLQLNIYECGIVVYPYKVYRSDS